MEEKLNKYAILFKALSDVNRLLIIDYLKGGERCACVILEQLQISQPTLSHHMKILCENDIVKYRKDGKWMHYSLNGDKFNEIMELLEEFTKMDSKSAANCTC